MSHTYKFEVGYTKLGTASAPSSAPTINVLDIDADTLLVTAGTTTASAVMSGVYSYSYSGTEGLTLRALFHTTDTSVDQQDLFSTDMNASVVLGSGITVGAGARTTMADIIAELRMLTAAGTADYTLAGATFWSDSQLQDELDKHYDYIVNQPMEAVGTYGTTGAWTYFDYYVGAEWLEQTDGGTATFYIQDGTGALIAAADYSVDYQNGVVTFDSDTAGAVRNVTCYAYDVNAAAAEIWRKKAQYYFSAVDFSTDNHSIKREGVYLHCIQQAQHFEALSWGADGSADLVRSDDLIDG